ncbi:MAG: hypothetical protein ACYCOU_25390 [Sulfobacillus sp.]
MCNCKLVFGVCYVNGREEKSVCHFPFECAEGTNETAHETQHETMDLTERTPTISQDSAVLLID